jgi:hypothetical protein
MIRTHREAYQGDNVRAQHQIKKKIVMPVIWKKLLLFLVRRWTKDMDREFTFRSAGGVSYKLRPDYSSTAEEEVVKGKQVFMLAAVARELSAYKMAGKLHIQHLDKRHIGRLTNWCYATLGMSTTMQARVNKPPKKKTAAKKKGAKASDASKLSAAVKRAAAAAVAKRAAGKKAAADKPSLKRKRGSKGSSSAVPESDHEDNSETETEVESESESDSSVASESD